MFLSLERFLVEKFGLSKVLEGLKAKAYQSFQTITFHYQIDALWSRSELKAPRAPEASLFIMKTMPCDTYWSSRRPGGNQSFQTITFHYRNDALWDILKLKVQRRPPELLKHHFSLSNRCPVSHFGAQGTQKAARALKALLFVIKWMR